MFAWCLTQHKNWRTLQSDFLERNWIKASIRIWVAIGLNVSFSRVICSFVELITS